MLWFGLKLLGMGKWLADAARRIAQWILFHPWQAACIALLVAAAWLWHGKSAANDRADACAAGRAAERASYIAAGKEAERLARAAKAAQEAKYTQLAKDADHAYETDLANARTAADRYIASHRVRAQAVGDSRGTTVASAQGGNPGVPEIMPAVAVVVSDSDVQACTGAVAYGIAAHDWAASLAE